MPCCAYHSARAGSMTRAITLGTSNWRWAIWAIVRFVLSPSVEAMKTSASSMPASRREQRAAADLRRLLGGEHDRLDAAALGLLDDRRTGAPRAHRRGGDLDAFVLLPHRLGPGERRAGALELGLGERGVDGQRHRHDEDPHRLDGGAGVLLQRVLVLLGGQAPGGLHDVVVERAAEERNEDRAVLRLVPVALRAERRLGDDDPPQE